MSYRKDTPYNDLPLLPPDINKWESIEIYKSLSEARAALAELKGRCPVIPNPMMLINTLVLQEAKDSSSIENIFTTSDKLYRAFASAKPEPDTQTKEVIRYRQATLDAWSKLQKNDISLKLLVNIFKQIKEASDAEGIRDEVVYIGNAMKTIYTPPCCKKVLTSKLENWVEFANKNDGLDPLIKMAILHYQFEAIHPFTDGNGRTGRVMNVLFISKKGLLDKPVLYLSKYINEYKNDYYRLLKEVTENGNWADWILFMLKGVKDTSVHTLKKVNDIYELYKSTVDKVKKEANDIYSYELIEMLFNQPYCKISFLVDSGIASRNTASKYLGRLVEIGVLSKEQSGSESLYLNKELFKILSQ
jgi:Fic family protein